MLRLLPILIKVSKPVIRLKQSKMSDFGRVIATAEEINKTIKEAQKEADELDKLIERYVLSNLEEEHEQLKKTVQQMKLDLIQLEVANGIEQIPVQNAVEIPVLESPLPQQSAPDGDIAKAPILDNQKQPNKEGKKKENKEKQAKKEEPKKKQDGGEEPPVDVGRLDLRVGKIVDVKKHPDADSLYLEQIDVGQEKLLTVVSGLVKHVPIEEMSGRMVILLCNLKPAKMRGVMSEAMVMCASTPDKVEILSPPSGALPGDLVHVEGYPRSPDPVLNPKKKIFEAVAPDLKTDLERNATYKGVVWTVPGKGNVTTASLTQVNIK